MQPSKPVPFSHVLICRTDNIGDVVLTLPLAGYLKQRYPDIRIDFLCRSYAAPMVRYCQAIDHVAEIDTLADPVAYLKKSGIDTVIFGMPDRRLAAAAWKAGVRNRIGTSHRWFHWLTCNRLAHFSRVQSELHEAQLNFELLRPLGIDHIPALDELAPLYRLHAPRHDGEPPLRQEHFNLVLHPKSNGNGREWPIAHFAELARLLKPHVDIKLWVTGSSREGEWLRQHGADLLQQPNVADVCGRFGLDQLASFIRSADGLIASGTGPLHMAAALGQRTLGLFPPVRPIHPGRWGAVGARAQNLCQPTPCAGCDSEQTCTCMRDLAPAQVAEIVLSWRGETATAVG